MDFQQRKGGLLYRSITQGIPTSFMTQSTGRDLKRSSFTQIVS